MDHNVSYNCGEFHLHQTKEAEMVTMLMFSTNGSENPTKVTLPFVLASGAIDAGHKPGIALVGDAVVAMKDSFADNIQGMGLPPFKELFAKAVANSVPIYV
jgi:predicted peroxiredoxin